MCFIMSSIILVGVKLGCIIMTYNIKLQEHSRSVVECLTRDRGAAGSSLTGVTVLCP